MKKLPIGIQTFEKIRTKDDYVYVDKTEIIQQLIKNGGYYFLSRPRRFGKSLLLDTLQAVFEGKKSLFKGLAIYKQWDWQKTYPVIKISLGAGVHHTREELDKTIHYMLKDIQEDLGIECDNTDDIKPCFKQLIKKAFKTYQQKVVILIDEYDKPILDNITDKKVARIMRDRLKNIYSVIKDSDQFIKFVFITGVSKFSKVNLFSGLNNLQDITIDKRYATICGYTHHDLETTFKEHLQGVDMALLKDWYNGYNYLGDKVYNPFDILLFIARGAYLFDNFWWSTGNPSFLLDLLREKDWYIPEVENYTATSVMLDSFDVDHIELVALLWQTGYLTIKEEQQGYFGAKYLLTVPNREIQTSLNVLFIQYLTTQTGETLRVQETLFDCLQHANIDGLQAEITRVFAAIPYNNFTNNKLQDYEGYYASVMYAYLASLGLEIIAEDTTNHSRIDLTLKTEKQIYLFEIKAVDKPTGKALQQIKERQYYKKYQGDKVVYCIGIEFCKQERNVCLFEWETYT